MKQLSIAITAVSLATAVYADFIYDGQTYDYDEAYSGSSIWYERWETADDFEVEDFWTLEMVRVWLVYSGEQDIRVDIFSNGADDKPAAPPPGDLYYEEVPAESIIWTDTGDSMYVYPIYQLDIPIAGFSIEPATRYWLGLQSISGDDSYWLIFFPFTDWWAEMCIFNYGQWYNPGSTIFEWYDCMFELHGSLFDDVDPEITETYPHDSDFPSGVPVDTNVTFHVTDDVSGCDMGETTCAVEESGSPVSGDLTFDDSDPLDVAFEWEPDDYYAEWTDVDVTVETYDLAGNGPVTEEWSFTTGYVNVAPASLGVIKVGFIE